ncbi:hypothetical protein ACFUJX_29850 [Streptomyces rubiginosohelvolus]|uniref:hypothetical protein n=1 Tax=Streptomyces TaxID=1883 RepID=UPI000BF02EE4|nr:hypothetical protein [Streptomyces sp. b62]RUP63547.1 hypothetical protein SSPNP10_34610 [Streptomyces sp. NP10]
MHELTGVTVQLGREQRLAGGHWLLGAAPSLQEARATWEESGSAWLRPGVLFGAVVVRAGVVHAALGMDSPIGCAPLVDIGGPVFYSDAGFGREGAYTALVPAPVALVWSVNGSLPHHRRALLEVPAPQVVMPERAGRPWWVVPLDGPGLLCDPNLLADLVKQGTGTPGDTEGGPSA